ncbi:hypothetical protein [Streptomyces sp. NPDC047869]|uniref:hypothetical protein n=1 Tax=Streptomyces sp. NPDC047869 TaxID=3154709 RepID=UPI003453CB43
MADAMVRWDQRAVALVELRGSATDQALFEDALGQHEWPVLDQQGPSVSSQGVRVIRYTVELRFPGSSFRAVTGARHRLEVLADRLRIDLIVKAVDRVEREPDVSHLWSVYRRARDPAAHPGLSRRARLNHRMAELRGTGRKVRADDASEAHNLGLRALPGAPAQPSDASVRPAWSTLMIRGSVPARPRRPVIEGLRLPLLVALVLGMTFVQSSPAGHTGPSGPQFWSLACVAVVVAVIAAAVTVCNRPELPAVAAAVPGPALCGLAGFGGVLIGWPLAVVAPDGFAGLKAFGVLLLGLLTFLGLWLLFRQSTWRTSLPWLLPALLPFIPGLLPAIGLSLPTVYLGAFDVDVEDVQLSMLDELRSAFHVLAAISLWLIAPALLGLVRHLHLMVRDRWMGYAAFAVFSAWSLLIGAWQLAYLPALDAGDSAESAAAYREGPIGAYGAYGIEPEWVCVRPVAAPDKVPVTGGELYSDEPYLWLGEADRIAVLWSPPDYHALKVPLDFLRIKPYDSHPDSCDSLRGSG